MNSMSSDFNKFDDFLETIRGMRLAEHAAAVRTWHGPVTVTIPDKSSDLIRGGMNIHIPVQYADGVRWLARIQQQKNARDGRVIESEACTMNILNSIGLKVPKAYKPQDCDFIFVEHIEGTPCDAPIAEGNLTNKQQDKIINELASFNSQLSTVCFKGVGSLCGDVVGPLISCDFFKDTPPFFFGPFTTNADRYISHIDHVLLQIEQGRTQFEDPVATYIAHLWLKDLIRQDGKMMADARPTFLKHADDKGDQILIDQHGSITAIIDWEWAYTAPKDEAFAAPLALVDVDSFFKGSNELSCNEQKLVEAYLTLQRHDLADCVRNGKVYQRLHMVIGQDPVLEQLHALENALTGRQRTEKSLDEWLEGTRGCYQDLTILDKLEKLA